VDLVHAGPRAAGAQASSARSKASWTSGVNRTNRTSSIGASLSRTVPTAMRAASSSGQP